MQGKTQSPRRDSVRRTEVAQGQKPFAIILTCSDSRLAPEVVFDEGLGDLFVVRVAGNTAPDPILIGSMEYSALTFGSILLMVLGHERCGAVEAATDVVTKGFVPPGEIAAATAPIVPAVQAVQGQPADQLLDAAIQENVRQTVQTLGQVPTLAELVQGPDAERQRQPVGRAEGVDEHRHVGALDALEEERHVPLARPLRDAIGDLRDLEVARDGDGHPAEAPGLLEAGDELPEVAERAHSR